MKSHTLFLMMPVLLTVHSAAQDSIVPGKLTVGDSLLDDQIALDVAGGFKVVKKPNGSVVNTFSMDGKLNVPEIQQTVGNRTAFIDPNGLWMNSLNNQYEFAIATGGDRMEFFANDYVNMETKYQFLDTSWSPLMFLSSTPTGGSTLTLSHNGLERIKLDATLGKITIAGSDVLTQANIATGSNNFQIVSNLAIRGGDPVTGNYFFSADASQTKIPSNTLALGAVNGNTTLAGTPVYEIQTQDGGASTVTHRSHRWGHVTNWDTSTLGKGYQKYATLGSWSQFDHSLPGGGLGYYLWLNSPEPGALPSFESKNLEWNWHGPMMANATLLQNGVGALSASNGRATKSPMFHTKSWLTAGAVESELAFYDTRTANKMLSVRSITPATNGVTGSSTLTTSTFEVRHPFLSTTAPAILSVQGYAGGTSGMQLNTNAYFNGEVYIANSVALSSSSAVGFLDTAMGGSTAAGGYSTAMSFSDAYGEASVAGAAGYTEGDYATAFSGGQALGDVSMAVNGGASVGNLSFAAGGSAQSYNSAAFGRFNKVSGSATTWVETDPLLIVGNGSSGPTENRSNALEVLKNGRTTITNKAWKNRDASKTALDDPTEAETDSAGEALIIEGHTVLKGKVIIAEPQGDIPMFVE